MSLIFSLSLRVSLYLFSNQSRHCLHSDASATRGFSLIRVTAPRCLSLTCLHVWLLVLPARRNLHRLSASVSTLLCSHFHLRSLRLSRFRSRLRVPCHRRFYLILSAAAAASHRVLLTLANATAHYAQLSHPQLFLYSLRNYQTYIFLTLRILLL